MAISEIQEGLPDHLRSLVESRTRVASHVLEPMIDAAHARRKYELAIRLRDQKPESPAEHIDPRQRGAAPEWRDSPHQEAVETVSRHELIMRLCAGIGAIGAFGAGSKFLKKVPLRATDSSVRLAGIGAIAMSADGLRRSNHLASVARQEVSRLGAKVEAAGVEFDRRRAIAIDALSEIGAFFEQATPDQMFEGLLAEIAEHFDEVCDARGYWGPGDASDIGL